MRNYYFDNSILLCLTSHLDFLFRIRSDIGDRKAIEKTSQALRDGAAGLRKELSEDLGDPDFLSGLFDMDSAKAGGKSKSPSSSLKDKDKPLKAKPAKKGHRRTKSNPTATSKAAAKGFKKQKSHLESGTPSAKSPLRANSLPLGAPLSPGSPRHIPHPGHPGPPGHSGHPLSPPGWSHFPPGPRGHFPPPYPPEHFKGRPYHRSHSHHMTPPPPHHRGPPRPPHAPHSWSHGPPRYPGPTSPPAPQNVVQTPQSPLPPGRHQLTANGCISKPPPSPVVARWSPRHFPRQPYPGPHPPEYGHGRPDYHPSRPEYARSQSGPEFWPQHHPDNHHHHHHHHHRSRHHYRDHHDYYRGENIDVPSLGGEDRCGESSSVPPEEFSPPVTPSRRRKPSNASPCAVTPSPPTKVKGEATTTPERLTSDASEGTRTSMVVSERKCSTTKDDATQNTVMSPMSSNTTEGDGHHTFDVDMKDCGSGSGSTEGKQQKPVGLLEGGVHVISVVRQVEGERLEEGIEFMLKQDPTADDYSLSPLPYEGEDPTTLMELPDDILHMPVHNF